MGGTVKKPTLRSKLVKSMSILAFGGMLAMVAFLIFEYQEHDLEILETEIHERAKLLRTGLLSTMMATGDREIIRAAVQAYIKNSSAKFNLFESRYVQRQFGGHPSEMATDPTVISVLEGKMDDYSALTGSNFRHIMPIISEERCQRCHEDLNGDPIPVGTRLGVIEFQFDVSARQKKALLLVSETVLGIIIFIGMMLFTMYRVFNATILTPIRVLTDDFAQLEKEQFNITLQEQETEEMHILVQQAKKTAAALKEKKIQREKALEEEQKKLSKIRSFALQQADQLGITNQNEITHIITRLSEAVKGVEKSEMLAGISKWVTLESKKLTLANDINLIRPAAFYLTELITTFDGSVKKGAVELALEEAITNAIVHGNLEVSSSLKEESFEEFDRQVRIRPEISPYSARKVEISYNYVDGKATFIIRDNGSGFNWSNYISKGESDQLELHGRGIIIMRTFATSLEFNEKGDVVTLTFEIENGSKTDQTTNA